MKVVCLSCGHKVNLDDGYDNYAGQVRCVACGAILEIRTEGGDLRSVALAREVARAAAVAPPEVAP